MVPILTWLGMSKRITNIKTDSWNVTPYTSPICCSAGRALVLCLVLIPLLANVASAQVSNSVGYVFELKGKWALEGNLGRPLLKAEKLPPGGVIRYLGPDGVGESFIVIYDRNMNFLGQWKCEDADTCAPITIPASVSEPNGFTKFFTVIMTLIRSNPKKFEVPISRDGSDLQDAVIELKNNKIDLGHVFEGKKSDKYLLRFEPDLDGGPPSLEPISFDWRWDDPKPLNVKGIKPGLYHLQSLDKSGNPLGLGNTAWVLLAPPGEYYKKASEDFQKIKNESKQWTDYASKKTILSFLRATLSYLASQQK